MHELLTRRRELTRLSHDTVERYALLARNEELQQQFVHLDEEQQREFIERRQFVDLLTEYPVQPGAAITAPELAGLLRPLAPRSYSIASSQAVVGEEVHLTVATFWSNAAGTERCGVASDFLNHRLAPGDEVGVFLEPNPRFRLPHNLQSPLILIGAGTGIAPYRAFLQHIEQQARSNETRPDTWLIFGNPHLRTDFLYQREWLDWRQRGFVNRIDCAFSRDQAEKRYVQHVVKEQGARIEEWLSRQARIYVCGCVAMGRAVEEALREVLVSHRGLDPEQAQEQLAELRRQGRLLKDLY
jgi:sulfite reductase (NADPH) flavoprotein alpha-component